MGNSNLKNNAISGVVMILWGVSFMIILQPLVWAQGGAQIIFVLGGLPLFFGVVMLLAVLGARAERWARIREARIPDYQSATEGIPEKHSRLGKRIGRCMVCKEELFPGEPIASCPSCGGIAHRGDLLEWLHVKGTCPACGDSLHGDQIETEDCNTRSRRDETSRTRLSVKTDSSPRIQ